MKALALIAAMILAATEAWALTPQEAELAKNSDSYLQSVVWLEPFKRSECGYALAKRNFPTLDTVWMTEILPAFQPQARNELATFWPQAKEKIVNAAKKYDASPSFGVDKKTECGIQAGIALGLYDRFRDQWLAAKKQYGRTP